ncbi:MAG: STAS domain-containing protein [Thermoanaerobaculia bacterium]|nr:STAS domain-containing protein [Thermoanaerobaculia bacterium]
MNVDKRGEVAVVTLEGRLAAGVGDEQLRKAVDGLLADGERSILLDLSGVAAIDSSGIGELVAGLRVCDGLGARLKILQVPDRVHHALSLGQMLPLFEIYDREDEALSSFGPAGESQA